MSSEPGGGCKRPMSWMMRLSWLLCLGLSSQVLALDFPHQARVVEITDLTHDVKRVRLVLLNPDGFVFKPGQFVFLKVPEEFVQEWNTRYRTTHGSVFRPYSFASPPSRLPEFDFIIKHFRAPPGKDVPPGVASTYVHTRLRTQDVLHLSDPTGTLYLGQDSDRPILVVAGGSGAAPFVGLLEYWFEAGMNRTRKIHFFFGVRSRRDLLLHDLFSRWAAEKENFTYTPALSSPREGDDWQGETGYIQLSVDKYVEAPSEAEAYLAGPPIMVKMVTKVLRAKGLPDSRIFFDQILARE